MNESDKYTKLQELASEKEFLQNRILILNGLGKIDQANALVSVVWDIEKEIAKLEGRSIAHDALLRDLQENLEIVRQRLIDASGFSLAYEDSSLFDPDFMQSTLLSIAEAVECALTGVQKAIDSIENRDVLLTQNPEGSSFRASMITK